MNKDYFKTWSDNMAYILGFLAADGWIYLDTRKNRRYGRVGIAINKKDIDVLEKIADEIGVDRDRIHHRESDNTVYMYMYSTEMYDDLVELGLTQSKSLTLKWINVPKEYIRHFVRGYFDGDGSLTEQQQTKNSYKLTIQFLGTENFLEGIIQSIGTNLGIEDTGKKIEKTNSKAMCLRYRTQQARNILTWLYKDSDMYMNRKLEKFNCHLDRKKVQRL